MSALQADWQLIQQLYMQGIALAAISSKTGVKPTTIASRACRHRWRAVALEAKQVAQCLAPKEAGLSEEQSENTLDTHSQSARKALSASILACLAKVGIPADETKALKQQAALEPLVRNARAVFGWNDSSGEPTINIARMALCTLVDAPAGHSSLVTRHSLIDVPCEKHALLPSITTIEGAQPNPKYPLAGIDAGRWHTAH